MDFRLQKCNIFSHNSYFLLHFFGFVGYFFEINKKYFHKIYCLSNNSLKNIIAMHCKNYPFLLPQSERIFLYICDVYKCVSTTKTWSSDILLPFFFLMLNPSSWTINIHKRIIEKRESQAICNAFSEWFMFKSRDATPFAITHMWIFFFEVDIGKFLFNSSQISTTSGTVGDVEAIKLWDLKIKSWVHCILCMRRRKNYGQCDVHKIVRRNEK